MTPPTLMTIRNIINSLMSHEEKLEALSRLSDGKVSIGELKKEKSWLHVARLLLEPSL